MIQIDLPTQEPVDGYRRGRVDTPGYPRRLTERQRDALAHVLAGLVDATATLASGRTVRTPDDALAYMLEAAADAIEAE